MIKGISDKRRFPRIGKIRLGIKKENARGVEYPSAVDYFVVNPDQSTSEEAAKAFRDVYKEKPRAIDVMFPVNDVEKFFPQFYRRYGSGSGLLCKGDGETATEIDRETGEIIERECDPAECEWAAKKHCRPVGTLQFLLYKVPGLGIWQIDTSSYHSIVNLNSAIDFIRGLTGGKISWIPLKLLIRPKEVQVEGRKKTVFVLDLASEEVKLQNILTAAQKTPAQFLLGGEVEMPQADMDTPPDDLYPASLINNVEEEAEEKIEEREEPDPADKELHELWDILGTPPAKRNAVLGKPDLDKEKLLHLLKAEVDKQNRLKKGNKEKDKETLTQPTILGGDEPVITKPLF